MSLTQQELYSQFTDVTARREYLISIAQAVSQKLLTGGSPKQLASAGARAAQQRRLLVWSSDAPVEQLLIESGYAGTLPSTNAPSTGFAVVNAAGTKLDYYLDRTMSYERSSCSAGAATATFTLHNGAPTSGLPPYVTTRLDSQAATAAPGDNRLLVTYYGSAGASIAAITVDGKPVSFSVGREQGLSLATVDLELPVGASRTIAVHVNEPKAVKPLQVLKQPLVRPMSTTVSGPSC